MLAGIPQRPEAGNPINGPTWALNRRNVVLSRMLSQNSITQEEYVAAKSQPITGVYARPLDLPSPYVAVGTAEGIWNSRRPLYGRLSNRDYD